MKSISYLLGACVIGAMPVCALAQLTNGNLDATSISGQVLATPTGWTINANRTITGAFNDGASSEGFAGDPTNTINTGAGDQGLFFKPFSGDLTNGDLTVNFFQDNAAIAGGRYSLSAYVGAESGYSGLIPGSRTQSILALEFLGAGGVEIPGSGVELDLRAAGLGGNPGLSYELFTINSVAPAGTLNVRARVSMIDAFGNTGGQAFVVDDLALVVPEPASIAMMSLGSVSLLMRRRSAAKA